MTHLRPPAPVLQVVHHQDPKPLDAAGTAAEPPPTRSVSQCRPEKDPLRHRLNG